MGGGLQDDYSQYSGYAAVGNSSSGRYPNQAGGVTEYAQQYRTSGGLQMTDDFSYYQRYRDNSGMFGSFCCNQHTQFHKLSTHETDVGKKLSQLVLINVHVQCATVSCPLHSEYAGSCVEYDTLCCSTHNTDVVVHSESTFSVAQSLVLR